LRRGETLQSDVCKGLLCCSDHTKIKRLSFSVIAGLCVTNAQLEPYLICIHKMCGSGTHTFTSHKDIETQYSKLTASMT